MSISIKEETLKNNYEVLRFRDARTGRWISDAEVQRRIIDSNDPEIIRVESYPKWWREGNMPSFWIVLIIVLIRKVL